MAKIFGQLEKAQLENTTSDATNDPKGMAKYRTDTNVMKVSNGTAYVEIADLSTAQQLSSKSFASFDFVETTTPANPAAGKRRVYMKANGNLYSLDSTGIETQLNGSGSSSSGGGGGSDLASQLSLDELDLLTYEPQNTIIDDFDDTNKGTKTNCAQASSVLRPNAGSNSWSYERIRDCSTVVGSAAGFIVSRLQAVAPKNTAIAADTIKFTGDVTNLFTVGAKVLIAKEYTSDGVTVLVGLKNALNALASNVTVSSVSYSSGPDETTLVLNNPSSLDLTLGLSSSEYNDKLRVRPFDYNAQIKSKTASSYEDVVLTDVQGLATIQLLGEAFYRELTGLTGSMFKLDAKMSPSQQYGLLRVVENVSSNDLYHFFYTADSGKTWTKYGTTFSHGQTTFAEESNGGFYRLHPNQIVVGDNGKWFSTFWVSDGSFEYVGGAYGDISGSPTISATPTTGPSGVGNNYGAGIVVRDTGISYWSGGGVAASTTLDFICVSVQHSSNACYFIKYSNGGSTYFGSSGSNGVTTESVNHPSALFVTGALGTSKIHWIHRTSATDLVYKRWPESSLTADTNTTIQGGGWFLTNAIIDSGRDRLAIAACTTARTAANFYDITTIHSGTPGVSAAKTWFASGMGLAQDNQNGSDVGDIRAVYKTLSKSVYLDPSDNKHQYHVQTLFHPDGVVRTAVSEIRDITTVSGPHISQYSVDSNSGLRDTSANTQRGQTFTATSAGVKCIGVRVIQNAKIPEGNTLTMKIYATSAGLPTGAALYTSTNTFDPARLAISGNGNGQWIWFNFDGVSLTNAVVYAFVLESAFAISASNYLSIKTNSAGGYGSGNDVVYNGTSWSANAGRDWMFEIRDHWMHQPGYDLAGDTGATSFGTQQWHAEAQLDKNDSSTIRYSFRRAHEQSSTQRYYNGHPYSGLITISGSATVASTVSSPTIAGYPAAQHDENVMFSVAPGSAQCAALDVLTGAASTTNLAEERSGRDQPTLAYSNIVAGDYIADAFFPEGVCVQLNGSNKEISYNNQGNLQNLQNDRAFILEGAFKTTTNSTNQAIHAKFNSAASYGWVVQLDGASGAGRLRFEMFNSGGSSIGAATAANGTITANTGYIYRVVYDGNGTSPRIYLSTTTPSGTFTEVSYVSQSAVSASTTSTSGLNFGSANGGSFFSGKLGYFKLLKFRPGIAPTQVYAGFLNQAAFTYAHNLGTKLVATRRLGTNSQSLSTYFNKPAVIDATPNTAAVVDSRDIALSWESQAIVGTKDNNMSFKLTGARTSSRDQSGFPGLNVKFTRQT